MKEIDEFELLDTLLWRVAERHKAFEETLFGRQLRRRLSSADIRAVLRIGQTRRERMSTLAKSLKLTMGTLTITIDRLVKNGYVLRERPDDDRRVVEVSLSPKGSEVYRQLKEARRATSERIFSSLNPEERIVLRNILTKLSQNSEVME